MSEPMFVLAQGKPEDVFRPPKKDEWYLCGRVPVEAVTDHGDCDLKRRILRRIGPGEWRWCLKRPSAIHEMMDDSGGPTGFMAYRTDRRAGSRGIRCTCGPTRRW